MKCLAAQAADRFGDSPAVISSTGLISFREFENRVGQSAVRLTEMGVNRGDRVGILLPNGIDQIILIISLIRIGAVACPISTKLPPSAVEDCLKEVGATLLVSDEKGLALTGRQIVGASEIMTAAWSKPSDQVVSLYQPAVVIFTSGSTGGPKAVMLTLGNLYYNALGSNENISFGPGDRWLLSLPLFHVGGLGVLFRALVGGGAVVVANRNQDISDAVLQHEITHLSLVSTQLRRLLSEIDNRQLVQRRLKAVLIGGSGIPSELIRQSVERKLPVYTSYGLSEMASQVTTSTASATIDELHTSGRLLPYRQLRIAKSGEIEVRGDTRFAGYADGNNLIAPFDRDGWFATGDIGSLDASGLLTVFGRRDTMFISGGENIYPEEIERALLRIDSILDAVVVPIPHSEYGHRPCAFVRTAQPLELTIDRIRDELRHWLPSFKLPDRIFPWPEGVASAGFKPDRTSLRLLAQKLTASSH